MATFNPECMNGKGRFGCIGSLERPDTFNVSNNSFILYSYPIVCLSRHFLSLQGCQWCGSGVC
jgi:hypothetical protein